MDKISVIIPFLNEGDEVYKTVESIRQTSGKEVNVILINDASTDGYDYHGVSERFNTLYVEHIVRRGVAFSRDEAINMCDTEYFLLLDGHMRFLKKGWSEKIICALRSDSRAIFCGQTKVFHKDEDGMIVRPNLPDTYGAYIDFEKENWKVLWNYKDPDPASSILEIPVILGAAYACNKTYWQKLGGLEGLIIYGMDEQLISLKAWLEGGSCKLLKDVVIEHLYRKSFPYPMGYFHEVYNRLYLSELLLPTELKDSFMNKIIQASPKKMAMRAMEDLIAKEDWMKERQQYYKSLFIMPFESILSQHRKVKEMQK